MKFSVFQVSRRGGREKNEDRMGYCYTRESGLFVLADGMGGHPEGEVAAQLALQTISALYQKEARPALGNPTEFLGSAVMAAHHQIIRYASEKGMLDTPRTTVVAALLQGGALTVAHCGDSRFYLVRNNALLMRTRDHSYLEQTQNAGVVQLDRINRNILFTCLGSPSKPVFDLNGPILLQQGDKMLLCSDGLWGSLPEADIVRHLGSRPVGDAAPELVELALRNGGSHGDNVTVIALEWETPDAVEPAAVSTDTISDGEFASTIQAGVIDTQIDDLDDDAIERSIAEINAAIKRTASRKAT